MISLFYKLFVTPFYKAHLVFYAFLLMACFGVVTRNSLLSYHLFIMQTILDKPVVLAVVLLLWLFYNSRCSLFYKKLIDSPDGSFLYELQSVSTRQQYLYFLLIHLLLLLPFLIYAGLLVVVAIDHSYFINAGIIVFFWLVVIAVSVRLFYQHLNSTWVAKPNFFQLFERKNRQPKNLHFILLHYMNAERKTAFLLLKFFSFLLLYSVLVWNEGGFGRDFFVMFFQLLLLAHTPVAFESFQFMEKRFSFFRNLPVRTIRILGSYIFTYAIILLPDLIFLLFQQPAIFSITDIVLFYLIAVMTLFLLTAVLYNDAMKREDYFKVVFMFLFVGTFALNAGYLWPWLLIESSIGLILFFSGYHHYTPVDG